jgi:hypothetical protein
MSFKITTRMGSDEREPSVERMREVLDELDVYDQEHFSVAVVHESEWCLGAYPDGTLVWENVESQTVKPRHMNDITRDRVLGLWVKLSEGPLEEFEAEP